MNYLIAFIPALCFGILSPLVAYLGGAVRQQIMGQMVGGLLVAGLVSIFVAPQASALIAVISFITGIMCALGIAIQIASFRIIGVSRTMPISAGMQLSLVALGGVLLFHEWASRLSLIAGISAIILIVLGISFTAYTEHTRTVPGGEIGASAKAVSPAVMRRGIAVNFASALLLAGYVLTIRASGATFAEFMLPQSFGWLVGGLIAAYFYADKTAPIIAKPTLKQMIPGILFGIAVIFMQTANRLVGVATGFTISQLSVVIATFAGIWFLQEEKTRRELIASMIGVFLVVTGAVLIGVAKAAEPVL